MLLRCNRRYVRHAAGGGDCVRVGGTVGVMAYAGCCIVVTGGMAAGDCVIRRHGTLGEGRCGHR